MKFSAFSWMVGAATTVAGSWVSMRIHLHYDASRTHLDDLKNQILTPMSKEAERYGTFPGFSRGWGAQRYNANAKSHDSPVTDGQVLVCHVNRLREFYQGLDQSLLEDARTVHYKKLAATFESLRDRYVAHVEKRRKWIESMAQHFLKECGLPPHPAYPGTNYVMELNLAIFAYQRLTHQETRDALSLGHEMQVLMLGSISVAVGPTQTLIKINDVVDVLIDTERQKAAELAHELSLLQAESSSVSRMLSLELAAKALPTRCKLVPFWR